MRGFLGILVVCMAGSVPAPGAEPRQATMIQDVVAGQTHENGKARWNSVLLSNVSNVCGLKGADRKWSLGDKASADPRANSLDCVASSVWIDNRSELPIKCRATLKLERPDDSARSLIIADRVLHPGRMEIVVTAYGEKAAHQQQYATDCKIASARHIPPPVPECGAKIISVPDPDTFYPPEARASGVEGDVVVQYIVDGAAKRLRDIRVSESSGNRGFDLAALKVAQYTRATSLSDCGDRRYRFKVKFRLPKEGTTSIPQEK